MEAIINPTRLLCTIPIQMVVTSYRIEALGCHNH